MKTKMSKMMRKINVPLILLYVTFVMSALYIGHLLLNNDDDSLFIFICMSFVIYMFKGNMLFVLLIPLVFVNILNFIKQRKEQEGFALLANEESNIEERVFLVQWMKKNMGKFPNYKQFNTTLDEEKQIEPLSNIVDAILDLDMEIMDVKDIDREIKKFMKYVKYVGELSEEENADNVLEISYLEKLYAQISADYLNKKTNKEYSIIEKMTNDYDIDSADKNED